MARERMVTRKVIETKKYKVYKMEGLQLVELGEIETKGKVSETDLAKEYGVDKVIVDCIEEKKAIYGVPVSKFMEIAEFQGYVEKEEKEKEEV